MNVHMTYGNMCSLICIPKIINQIRTSGGWGYWKADKAKKPKTSLTTCIDRNILMERMILEENY